MAGAKRSHDDFRKDYGQQDAGNEGQANDRATDVIKQQDANTPPTKRPKASAIPLAGSAATDGHDSLLVARTGRTKLSRTDFLSPLSDELLIRILRNLPMEDLLSLTPVSRRFHRLADDSQLWKAIYYERFVLPRAMRFPGIRGGSSTGSARTSTGVATRGPFLDGEDVFTMLQPERSIRWASAREPGSSSYTHATRSRTHSWKQQFKLRSNWARGKCAVEELRLDQRAGHANMLAPANFDGDGVPIGKDGKDPRRVLVKVVDGFAVTVDRTRGLCVWELKTRSMIAMADLSMLEVYASATGREKDKTTIPSDQDGDRSYRETGGGYPDAAVHFTPTSLAVDTGVYSLDIAVGLHDGAFDIWQYDLARQSLVRRFSHAPSSSGPLQGIAYSHPYVLSATDSGLISLYAFGAGQKRQTEHLLRELSDTPRQSGLDAPHLLTSLRSHSSQPPLALSIRKLTSVTIASIAYTFSTRQGWSIGIQDLHIQAGRPGEGNGEAGCSGLGSPTVIATRLASTPPISAGGHTSPPAHTITRRSTLPSSRSSRLDTPYEMPRGVASAEAQRQPSPTGQQIRQDGQGRPRSRTDGGPTTLRYSHPYLLATMPDNTLILHLCTSNASTLDISPGTRLWGHTSGISDAEITTRGKAVSVSMHGDEMRVWELEGRPAAERGYSVAIKPNATPELNKDGPGRHRSNSDNKELDFYDRDERRNWVGFDDEMVIVLKESRTGGESLLVYDFT